MFKQDFWFNKVMCLFTAVCFFTVSVGSVFAQDSTAVFSPAQAAVEPQMTAEMPASIAEQAQLDARSDIKGGTWFIIGCLLGLIGWIIAYAVQPNPPATRMLGKSAEYIAVYSDTYTKEGKKLQTKSALTGCLVGTSISVLINVIVFTMASSQ